MWVAAAATTRAARCTVLHVCVQCAAEGHERMHPGSAVQAGAGLHTAILGSNLMLHWAGPYRGLVLY